MTDKNELLRSLPAVDAVLQSSGGAALADQYGHEQTTAAVRGALSAAREAILAGADTGTDVETVATAAGERLAASARPRLRRVINATGIILHTGLGRAVMPQAARAAMPGLAGCCNIQIDLEEGGRIKRETCIQDLVSELTGAEDVVFVNNNAGATLLALRALAKGKEAVVSRGELIEIGGAFRLPDVMSESGAVMKEVGTTNKTHLRDYAGAIGPETAVLLKVHKSNYFIAGFTKEVSISELVPVGREHGVPVIDDLGCGALVDLETYGLEHEPTIQESLAAGTDIVLASTDKLIGGPQGGLIVGRKELLAKIRACPLYRALRVDKMALAALEATLRLFLSPERLAETHPIYHMLSKTPSRMKAAAEDLAQRIAAARPDWTVAVVEDESRLGGGSVPSSALPAYAVAITSPDQSCDDVAKTFRTAPIPVIPYIQDGAVRLNLRTIFDDEAHAVAAAVQPPTPAA